MDENQNTTGSNINPSSSGASGGRKIEIKKRSMNPVAVILGISAVLFGLFLVFSMVYFFMKGKDKGEVFVGDYRDAIALIEVKGVIMDSKKAMKQLKAAEDSHAIKAVVLRLNSPGGAVAPSQEIYEAVKKFPKPLVVSMESVAASGAYYIAAGAKKVYANAGTLTGSIGVIMEFVNLKKLYEWAKVERFSIKTGKFKDSGAEYREQTPEEKAYFQELVFNTLDQFKGAVKEGRHMSQEEVDAIADGRVFTGQQALKLKMVDEIGTMQDAVDFIAKEAKIKGKPLLVRPAKPSGGIREFLMGNEDEDDFEEASSFVDRITAKLADRLTGVRSDRILPPGIYWIWNGGR